MTDIFISYSKQDRPLVEKLASSLEGDGFVVWWDTSLVTGDDYRTAIDKHLDEARAVIVVWTANSIASKWVISEAEHADARNKLIPLRTTDLDITRIPKPFTGRHTEVIDNAAVIRAALRQRGIEARYARGAHGSLHDRFWKEIEGSEHPEDFEQYLKEFPEGEHAAFARLKVARLKRVQSEATGAAAIAVAALPEAIQQTTRSARGVGLLGTLVASLLASAVAAGALWQGAIAPGEKATHDAFVALSRETTAIAAKLDTALQELSRPLKDDDTDWAEAERIGTLRAWNEYRRRRPAGLHEKDVDARIKARLDDGRLLASFEEHKGSVVRLEGGETANSLVSYDTLGQQLGWDLVTRKRRSSQRLLAQMVQANTGFRPIGPNCGYPGIKLTDTVTYRCDVSTILRGQHSANLSLTSRDDMKVVDFVDGGVLGISGQRYSFIYDAANRVTQRDLVATAKAIAVGPKGTEIAALVTDRDMRILRQSDGAELAVLLLPRKVASVLVTSVATGHAVVATGSEDGAVQLWDISDLKW